MNRIAANELRIKLSELCYKSISSDIAEDKKHIDLCTEPLILVCAVGLQGSNTDDVAKEVANHRAHRAAPIVITTRGETRFSSAAETIEVPPVHPDLGFVLSAMAGHVFGYEAALAIDASARCLRNARGMIWEAVPTGDFTGLARALTGPAATFLDALRANSYDGNLEAGTAVRLASLFRYATGITPLDLYEVEHGKVGTPVVVVEDLTAALTAAIDELTRTVDTIKHQAKTVTVGISRSDETLLAVPLVREVLAAGPHATRSATARCARSSHSTRRSSSVRSASRAIGSRATSRATLRRSTSSTAQPASRRSRRPTPRCAVPSTGSRPSARSPWRGHATVRPS